MIAAEHISKSFGDFSVLSDLSFQVPDGEIYGLVGYNGVGKTTLLKILSGIYRPNSGRAVIDDRPAYEDPAVKQQCFFMTEEATFFDQSSLRQMRRFYRGYYPGWSDKTFEGLVNWFGVDPDEKISLFSKGMQRQASLALAFSCGAKYLFLDEAFDGLDFTLRRQMRRMLLYYARERKATMVVSSHNLQELEDLADRIGLLSEGELIFDGSIRQMREQYVTCRFRAPEGADLSRLQAELTEQDGDIYLCVLPCTMDEVRSRLDSIGAEQLELRPVRLEEFFRKERREQPVDWSDIFG